MEFSKTKYVYRDLATGRLLHERETHKRPADSWVREAFVQPPGLQSRYGYLELSAK